jgi:Cu(I)/Ag(I) efflux system protein CusF
MTASPTRPWALAGLILLAACANSSATPTTVEAAPLVGVDLGPSSRVPRTQLAMAAAGHEGHRTATEAASGHVQRAHDGHNDAHASGTVNSDDPSAHKVNLSHGPIPSLGWPAMTMDFAVAPSVDLGAVKPGTRVNFSLEKGKGGMYEIQSMQPAGGGR